MAEETMNPVQEVPAASPPASSAPRKGNSSLLIFLTVLLIIVGIVDVILWSVVGYYFLQNRQSGNAAQSPQIVSAGGTASGGEATGGAADRDALVSYIQQISGMLEQETAVMESFGSVSGTNFTDDDTLYTEVSQRTIPLCQQLNEKVLAIVPEDAEISAAHGIYRDYVTKMLNALTLMTSALSNQDAGQVAEANDLINEANDLSVSYQQALRTLAEERNVSLNG